MTTTTPPAASVRSLRLGRRVTGRPEVVGWPLGHVLVAGTTGSGKSTTMNSILAQLAGWGDVALFGIDLKQTELGGARPRFTQVAVDHPSADRLLARVSQAGRARQSWQAANGYRNWSTAWGPWIVVVIDELAEYLGINIHAIHDLIGDRSIDEALADPDTGKQVASELTGVKKAKDIRDATLESIARVGRSAGIRLLVATQYPTASVVGSQFRAQIDWALAHRVTRDEHVDVCLGEGAHKVVPASAITSDEPGVFYLGSPRDLRPIRLQGHAIPDTTLAQRWEATAHLRYHPNQLTTPHTAEVRKVMA